MIKRINSVVNFLSVFVLAGSLIGFEWATSAQTPAKQDQSANTNAQSGPAPEPAPTKKRRTSKKKVAADTTATPSSQESVNTAETQSNQGETPAMGSTSKGRKKGTAARSATPTQDMSMSQQTDLSGTYAGVMNCPDAGMTGDTTLTITGNKFTLSDGRSGSISAATTRGYTAVAMRFDEAAAAGQPAGQASTTTPRSMSFRGRKSGDRLTLTPAPGGGAQCSFMPASMARSGRTKGKRRAKQPSATGEQVTNPSAAPTVTEPTTVPAPSPTPTPTPPRRQ